MITGKQIRTKFLDYFAAKDHTIVASAGLIPQNDPTLYFTNAGMVPFKNVFTGGEQRDYVRAASSQKCLRVSGKHNDLENVGHTGRHHTFFEMLGNFSFGDYFKKEAIAFAWEFLTRIVNLPKEKLWITVYRDDDEAHKIWQNVIGIKADRIKRMGAKDNFWSMGDTGPCGPCSEIHYEHDIPCPLNNPDCAIGTCDCDKYMEVWNLVFMQFDQQAGGKRVPLPRPSIDTGMGLERLAALLQGKRSNYESDLFTPILSEIEKIVHKRYKEDPATDVSMRVLADHIRATTFLINDGVLPSNEGRGYVLRRIMRRAIRHGKILGQTKPFFYKLVPVVIKEMGGAYPDLQANQKTIEKVIAAEEERFLETLEKGLKILAQAINDHKRDRVIPGDLAFKLYDTYGFPLDLTQVIANENGMTVDEGGFKKCMQEQRERGRAGWKGTGDETVKKIYADLGKKQKTKFLGYETLCAPAKVIALLQDGRLVAKVSDGEFEAVFDQTPFYAEGGGQVGDQGLITAEAVEARVADTQKPVGSVFVHRARIQRGQIKTGDTVQLEVFRHVRKPTMRNHTATHILNAALRKILGTHVRQSGSLVNDKLLRFDFTHFQAIPPETLRAIEDEVNRIILEDLPVKKEITNYKDAVQKKGALAFFGEKYGDTVRIVSVGDYSVELCGGTHVDHSSQIGYFKIVSEGSIAAGVRRIEAVTGLEAVHFAQDQAQLVQKMADRLKATPQELPEKVRRLQEKIKAGEREILNLKKQLLDGMSQDYLKNAIDCEGFKAVIYHANDLKGTREIATAIREKLGTGIAVITAAAGGKAVIVVSVTKDLTKKFPADKLLSPLAALIDGRGGGKPDMAQAGGTNVAGLAGIKTKLREILSTFPNAS